MFTKGKQKTGGRAKGGKNKKTVVTEALSIEKLQDLTDITLININYYLSHGNDSIRFQATKEIMKYLFPPASLSPGSNELTEDETERLRKIISSQMEECI